jgi:hypothetical protein
VQHAAPRPGLLPLLRALVAGDASLDPSSLSPAVVNRAVANGFGPILARVTRASTRTGTRDTDLVHAADLTARLLTDDLIDAVANIVRLTSSAGRRVVLLKGCSICLRYYPEPHLRTMGDIDLLVGPGDLPDVEALVRSLGFEETTATPPRSWYHQHHHGIPLWHARRRLWLELHTRLYPPSSPLAEERRFSPAAIEPFIISEAIGDQVAGGFSPEMQLVYTATRWASMPNLQRGAFPVLDAALLIASHRSTLDWRQVCALVDGTWGVTALRLMLTYLERWQLAVVPDRVQRHLADQDRFTNAAVVAVLHRIITTFVMEGRPLGSVVTSRNLRTAWSTLVSPTPRWSKPFRLLAALALPVSERDNLVT